MKNKKTLKLLILLILSIILFYVINIYAMNYNSDSYVNDLLIHTLSRYMMPVPILFILYIMYDFRTIDKRTIKEIFTSYFYVSNFNRYFLFSNKIFLKNEIKEIQKLIAKRNELILMNRSIRKYGFVPYSLLIDLNKENK